MAKKLSKTKPIQFALSYETAAALQSILTQQDHHIHSNELFQESLKGEFEQVLPFYYALSEYLDANK